MRTIFKLFCFVFFSSFVFGMGATPSSAADCKPNIGSGVHIDCTIPAGKTEADFRLRGAGGAGASGCAGIGGAGGGRGNHTNYVIQGPIGGWSITVDTGVGGYAPGACGVPGNNGSHTFITLPGGCILGAGGGERAIGIKYGAGGNAFVIGCDTAWFASHPGVTIANDNADSTAGSPNAGALGGIGGGNGDGGGGGNGGAASTVGVAGIGGYLASVFR